jgi:hypothetical protein
MSNVIQSYTSWQPLEEVIVGRVYTPEYFSFIKDPTIRGQMTQILEESNEDLDNLQRTIEQFGAIVRRPDLPSLDHFMQMQLNNNGVPIPPLTPRDWQITLGEKLLRVIHVNEMDNIINEYAESKPGAIIDPHGHNYDPGHVMVDAKCQLYCTCRHGHIF